MNADLETRRPPRLGFLGVGQRGRVCLERVLAAGTAEIVAVADPVADSVRRAQDLSPRVLVRRNLPELLELRLDGVVIATPTSLHVDQARDALASGVAVFCVSPMGRDAAETRRVVDAARQANRRVGVDVAYRHMRGVSAVRELIREGGLGSVLAAQLTLHEPRGDLTVAATELVDLLHFVTGRKVCVVHGNADAGLTDYLSATLELDGGLSASLACSSGLHDAGERLLEATFFGTRGAVGLRSQEANDVQVERFSGACRDVVEFENGDGAEVLAWVDAIGRSPGFDVTSTVFVQVAEVVEAMVARRA